MVYLIDRHLSRKIWIKLIKAFPKAQLQPVECYAKVSHDLH